MKNTMLKIAIAAAIFAYGNVVFGQNKAMSGNAAQTTPTVQGTTTPSQKTLNDNALKAKQERAARANEMRAKGMSEVAIKQHLGPALTAEDRAVEKTDIYKTKLNLTAEQEVKVNKILLDHEASLQKALEKAGTDPVARQAAVDKDHLAFLNDMALVLTPQQHAQLKAMHAQKPIGGPGNSDGVE